MSTSDDDRTASLMTPAKLAQLKARPPAASPAAWLDQMAADAGSGHVRRLLELRQKLEAIVRGREGEFRTVSASCSALHGALEELDFSLAQPKGFLARAIGKGKEAAANFQSQFQRVQKAGEDLADEVQAATKAQAVQGSSVDRMVLEFEAEVRAIEKIMEQGTRWLQDMRNQLKTRQAQGGDAAVRQQIRQDEARCELLVNRLKLLRGVTTSTLAALERCKGMVARRAALLASLQQLLDTEWKAARQRIAPVAEEVASSGAAEEGVERAQRSRAALQSALEQAGQDCASVQAVHQAAGDELAGLQGPLQAAV